MLYMNMTMTMPPIVNTANNNTAIDVFSRLDPRNVAFLFDVDGTLIELGPSPFEVHVPDTLLDSLLRLSKSTDGAVALVSGRPIVDLDRLFWPLKLPAIGGHGAETRLHGGGEKPAAMNLSLKLRGHLADAKLLDPGIVIEDKGYSVALHYRLAPKCAERLRKHVAVCRAAYPEEPTELLLGKAMFEVKRPGINKGDAVRELMGHAPFIGRMPVFIGDDITDEAVFKVLPFLGGKSFSVTRHFPGLAGIFESPAHVREALEKLASQE
jgi:trehalose 6-phosphate phosphatase